MRSVPDRLRLPLVALALATPLLVAPGPAPAQTALQDIDARADRDRRAEPTALAPRPVVQFTSQRPPSNAGSIRFRLSDIVVGGGVAFDEAETREAYGALIGEVVTLTRIYEVAAAIQSLYREADFIFTRVVVPAQEIEGGVVRLEIIEAQVETVSIEEPDGEVGPVREMAERMLAPLIGVANPTGAALERAILNINELPGVTRATVIPQAAASGVRGGLDLFVNVERDPFEAVIYADNRQTPGIGRGLIGGTATFNSYSASADTTSISYFNSFAYLSDETEEGRDGRGDLDERNTFLIAHQRAIGIDGGMLQASALYSRSRPGDDLSLIGIEGDQFRATIGYEYPVVRTRAVDLSAAIGFEVINSQTDISNGAFQLTDDKLRVVDVSVEGLRRDAFGYTKVDASLRRGIGAFGASEEGALLNSRSDGDATFTTIRAEVERLVILNDELSFLARIGGQYAFDPLFASEEFAIGGLSYGRGFDPSEYTGDDGFGLLGELRYATPVTVADFPLTVEGYGFFELGAVRNKREGEPQEEAVVSAGGGLRLFLPENYFIAGEIAVPLNQPLQRIGRRGTPVSGPRFFVNLSKSF